MNPWTRRSVALATLLLVGCAATPVAVPPGTPCGSDVFSIRDDFEGARRGVCTIETRRHARVEIVREHERVTNPSPWFAMRIEPSKARAVTIELDYGDWKHRYVPKVSTDGRTWTTLPAEAVRVSADSSRARVELQLGDEPLWLAAQELVMPADYDAWLQAWHAAGAGRLVEVGRSAGGRAIRLLDSGGDSRDVVLFVGRQHPPEVSGSLAMRAFIDTVFADTELAARYRERYRILVIPLLNPDGVVAGNWRGNVNGADLNRDWGPFEEPESRHVLSLLDALDADGYSTRLFIDFHSTDRNLFYTQAAEESPAVASFIERWFERTRARYEDYEFANEVRPTSDTPNGKNYMIRRYGIPSMTYEVGDETDRSVAAQAARVFAEELMRLMLDGEAAQ